MKKELVKFGFVVFAAVAMAACGGAEETTETPADAPAETTPAETTPAETTPAETTPAEGDTTAACDAGACEGTEAAH